MRTRFQPWRAITVALCLSIGFGCATPPRPPQPPTPIRTARTEIPEERLLDVGVRVLDPGRVTDKQREEEGTNEAIRKAESHYIAYKLKDTLQQSAHWGAVRVMPDRIGYPDLMLIGRIRTSNGEQLDVEFTAIDVSGRVWFKRDYALEVDGTAYLNKGFGAEDPFQSVYNQVANDLAEVKSELTPKQLELIRATSRMRFAADFSPEAYGSYVEQQGPRYRVARLPAEDDPMIERLMQVRDREYMYVDTLDEYYERYYQKMRPQYDEWRKFNQTELEALHELQRSSMNRIAGGVLLIAAAIALEAAGVENTSTLRDVLVLGGGAVVIDGINVSKEADIHRAGIEELNQSFSADIDTVVVEFEGKQVELKGTVDEQYQQWRDLLKRLYEEETGFGSDGTTPAPPVI